MESAWATELILSTTSVESRLSFSTGSGQCPIGKFLQEKVDSTVQRSTNNNPFIIVGFLLLIISWLSKCWKTSSDYLNYMFWWGFKGCIPLRCLSELVRCFHSHFTMFREPLIISISQSERKVNGRKRKKWFVVFVLVRSGRFVQQKSRAQSVVGHGFWGLLFWSIEPLRHMGRVIW